MIKLIVMGKQKSGKINGFGIMSLMPRIFNKNQNCARKNISLCFIACQSLMFAVQISLFYMLSYYFRMICLRSLKAAFMLEEIRPSACIKIRHLYFPLVQLKVRKSTSFICIQRCFLLKQLSLIPSRCFILIQKKNLFISYFLNI